MQYLIEGLNERQLEAVTATEGYVRIIAGAGSGKTKALTHRYAYLVKALGVPAGNILCVTFTNKAAGEMKKRVRKLIGDGYDTSLITTYHGFCARVLREDIGRLFFPENFLILDTSDQKKILEDIFLELELKLDYSSFENIMKKIEIYKSNTAYVNLLTNPERIINISDAKSNDEKIILMYLQRQQKVFGLDFNDLINFVFVLYHRFEDIKRKWQEKLFYIQVDEFQDSSERENKLINILSGVNLNIFIVGDPDQNIYEWRGSKVEILVDFDKNHENTKTIIMNQNYRSTPEILSVANELIDKNKLRIKKDLFTQNKNGDKPVLLHAKTEIDEITFITKTISSLAAEGYSYGDCAVLYRAGYLSRFVEQGLITQKIPYQIYGGVSFFDRMEIKDALSYLKLLAYDDDIAFERIINVPRRQFGKAKLKQLKVYAEENRLSLFGALKECINEGLFINSGCKAFIELIEKLREKKTKTTVSQLLHEALEASGYEKYIRENGNMERFDNIAELKKNITEFERSYDENLKIEEYIQHITLQNGKDEEDRSDRVKLMTIHASKGLEFPFVFLCGFNDGVLPSSRSLEERKNLGLEEERRLCFVAMSRAEKRLYLTESEGQGVHGKEKLPSRFIFDIKEDLFEIKGRIPDKLKNDVLKTFNNNSSPSLSVGDEVDHPVFGKGKILSLDEKKGVYSIYFDKLGQPRPISTDYSWKAISNVKLTEKAIHPEIQKSILTEKQPEKQTEAPKEWIITEKEPVIEEKTANIEESPKPELPKKTQPKVKLDKTLPNLWNDPNVPKDGWSCVGINDLGSPVGICKMCNKQIIRYVHLMNNENGMKLGVGCVCAGKMEGNIEGAVNREAEFKSKNRKKQAFLNRVWKKSAKNNLYINYKGSIVTIFADAYNSGQWCISYKGRIIKNYSSPEEAKESAFEILSEEI